MADTWQTIEQAAVTLGLSVRTVNRHITNGKLSSRLFEGRREVLVSPQAYLSADHAPSGASDGLSADTRSTTHPTSSANANQTKEPNGSAARENGETRYSVTQADDIARQSVSTADTPTDRPLDLQQTMLALADSIDDKASLAVAAYQTLARTAETQVQSLRRVAYSAWAVVGVLAIGAIVGVAWGTLRVMHAEMATDSLKAQLSREAELVKSTANDRDNARKALDAARDEQAAELRSRVGELAEQNRREAERAAYLIRQQSESAKPATAPTADPSTSPTANLLPVTQPATVPATKPLSATRPANIVDPRPWVPGQPTDVLDRR